MIATNDLQIGMIGVGGRGGLARHAHRPNDGSLIVACCNVSKKMLSKAFEV